MTVPVTVPVSNDPANPTGAFSMGSEVHSDHNVVGDGDVMGPTTILSTVDVYMLRFPSVIVGVTTASLPVPSKKVKSAA